MTTNHDTARIRHATVGDIDSIAEIERRSFAGSWSAVMIAEALDRPESSMLCACADDRIVGYALYRHVLDEAELLRIAVSEEARRSGHGALLVGAIIDECRSRGVATIHLEVNGANHAAIALYARCGFAEAGRRKNYYGAGEHALLMVRDTAL
ncbi:MAG TPA: ribosomal protein S18-alanine N-acetyltransferase [Spirochaetota bacterium]|mgnify:CR=1 FL=1|nr:ribosomal protein S18-alanine N-acetyltransferase [Spirochaetota bacterium]HPI22534.1 ribosomal protein S18-alanine N-acetyltransferase [Spirochaetota bacterium]HPU90325.1 ribosomal protein S18-alanine N-acetyltransferase [Spirochaetota bacterium]